MPHTFVAILALLLASPFVAVAESVVWSSSSLQGGGIPRLDSDSGWMRMDGAIATVQYLAGVSLLDDSGGSMPLSCGSTVPQGSKVKFSFTPHADEHISWFASGSAWDSPYGLWIPDATRTWRNGCNDRQYFFLRTSNGNDIFVRLSVNPPSHSLTGLSEASCSPSGSDGDVICTLNNSVSAAFSFGSTFGHFYADEAYRGCTPQGSFSFRGSRYALPIPEQTIQCPITVTQSQGLGPTTPAISSPGACIVGEPHTIAMTATDPDGDNIRYGIDWNADGTVDEFVPPSGYVPSGTSESAARTYATPGAKTVRVMAEDAGRMASGWTPISFTCAEAAEPPPAECPLGYSLQNDICVFVGCPAGYVQEDGICIPLEGRQCVAGLYCVGNQVWQRNALPQCTESFLHDCPQGWTCASGACVPPEEGGVVTATPSLVSVGDSSTIGWTTERMLPGSCLVSENNPAIHDTATTSSGSFQSSPIDIQTTYTLSCTTEDGASFTDTATVNILPVFQEE